MRKLLKLILFIFLFIAAAVFLSYFCLAPRRLQDFWQRALPWKTADKEKDKVDKSLDYKPLSVALPGL